MSSAFSVPGREDIHIGTAYWLKYIETRIKSNKNFICPIIGQTGSGKSYSALSLKYLISGMVDFNDVFFDAISFLKRLNTEEPLKGKVLLWDETGIGLNSKQWQSRANKVVNATFQTFRHDNVILFMTLPFFSFLDADARKLVHALFETQGIDFETNEGKIKPLLIQVNQDTGKLYRKYLRVNSEEGGLIPVERIRLPLCPKEILDEYEQRASIFKKNVKKEALDALEKEKIKADGKGKQQLNYKQANVVELYKVYKDFQKVADVLGVPLQYAQGLYGSAKKKLGNDTIIA